VVALRFDLCDRQNVAPCRDGQDGVLRLVLQPIYLAAGLAAGLGGGELRAHDVALHAVYPIAAAELAGVVTELRALAQLQVGPTVFSGFEQVRGLAYDPALKRLFIVEHSLTAGTPDKLHIRPLDQ
jgi:hypothetical protein